MNEHQKKVARHIACEVKLEHMKVHTEIDEIDIVHAIERFVKETDPDRDVRGGYDCDHLGMTGLDVCRICRERLTPKVNDITAFEALRAEMSRGRAKFPTNRKLLAALVEEVGELARALLQEGNSDHAIDEAIQVACVAMRIAVEGDADFDNLATEHRQK